MNNYYIFEFIRKHEKFSEFQVNIGWIWIFGVFNSVLYLDIDDIWNDA